MNREERPERGRERESVYVIKCVSVCARTQMHIVYSISFFLWAASLTEKLCPTPSPWDLPDPQQRSNESKIQKKERKFAIQSVWDFVHNPSSAQSLVFSDCQAV